MIVVSALMCAANAPAAAADGSGPYAVSPACLRDSVRASACDLVSSYFEAINNGRYRKACAMLGSRLRFETGGPNCRRVVASAGRQHFAILNARPQPGRVDVIVALDLPELGHVRVLRWLTVVGLEGRTLRILDTSRVT